MLDRHFLFVLGKGGVGKTTVSAALALAAARRSKRTLVAMCNVRERLSELLDVPPIGPEITPIAPHIDAVNMTPDAALREYGLMVLKVRALYQAIFENRLVSAFLHGTPGIEAWSMLGKAYFHATETDSRGRKRYDLVILDAPATGHGLDMLRVPRVISEVAPPGLLRREAEKAWDLFQDPTRSGVVLVTLPEDMPTSETIELYQTLRDELRLPVVRLTVNHMTEILFHGEEVRAVEELPARLEADDALTPLARAGLRRVLRERVQRASLERLHRAIPLPTLELPHLFDAEFARPQIEALSRIIDERESSPAR